MDWLKFVKSSAAKNKIMSWFKKEKKSENIEKGKELIEKELKRIGMSYADLFKLEYINPMLDRYKYKNLDDYIRLGKKSEDLPQILKMHKSQDNFNNLAYLWRKRMCKYKLFVKK